MTDFREFDRYLQEHGIAPGDAPEWFAHWLANVAKEPIISGPVDEAPTILALPEEKAGSDR